MWGEIAWSRRLIQQVGGLASTGIGGKIADRYAPRSEASAGMVILSRDIAYVRCQTGVLSPPK